MDQTTNGCDNCCFNGQCMRVDKCIYNTGNYDTTILNHTIGINEAYNHTIGINECGSNLPDDIVNNLPDDIITTSDFAKPYEPYGVRSDINYNVKVGVFYCAICGNDIPWFEGQNPNKARVCNECKQAIEWAKEKMKEANL